METSPGWSLPPPLQNDPFCLSTEPQTLELTKIVALSGYLLCILGQPLPTWKNQWIIPSKCFSQGLVSSTVRMTRSHKSPETKHTWCSSLALMSSGNVLSLICFADGLWTSFAELDWAALLLSPTSPPGLVPAALQYISPSGSLRMEILLAASLACLLFFRLILCKANTLQDCCKAASQNPKNWFETVEIQSKKLRKWPSSSSILLPLQVINPTLQALVSAIGGLCLQRVHCQGHHRCPRQILMPARQPAEEHKPEAQSAVNRREDMQVEI